MNLRASRDRHNPDIQCPAAEVAQPPFSLNKSDVRCRVGSGTRPSKNSPCCGEYATCGVWKSVRKVELMNSTKRERDTAAPGTMADDPALR